MSIKNKLHILGYGEWLGYAQVTALELGRWSEVVVTEISRMNDYTYDLNSYQKGEDGVEYFLALNGDAFGTVREQHLSILVSRGLNIASLLPDEWPKKINSLISPGAIVPEKGVKISFNVFVGPNAILAGNASIGRSSTIGSSTLIANNVDVGKNVSIACNVHICSGVSIGAYSSLECKNTFKNTIKNGYIESYLFDRPVIISEKR